MPKTKKAAEVASGAPSKPKPPRLKSREELIKDWKPEPRPPPIELTSDNRLEQYDYVREVTKKNVWYYRDRLSVPRGPCTLPVLRECWVNGIVDENTLIWGQGLMDWLPAKNIRTLVAQVRTPEGEDMRQDHVELVGLLVRCVTWLKKHLALKPDLNRMRKACPEKRQLHSSQVDEMY